MQIFKYAVTFYELEKQIADMSTMNGKFILGGVFNVVPDNNLNSCPPKGVKYVVVVVIIISSSSSTCWCLAKN